MTTSGLKPNLPCLRLTSITDSMSTNCMNGMFPRIATSLILLVATSLALAQSDEELLPPEEAFAFANELDGNELVASWEIADGYYMYQDKFAALSETEGIEIGELALPPGTKKDDPLFGEVVIYTGRVEIRVPLITQTETRGVKLEVWAQGCNEPIGVCYPPIKNDVSRPFALIPPAMATEANDAKELEPRQSDGLASLVKSLGSFSAITEDTLLEVDDAFKLNVYPRDGERLVASFQVEDGYYLYQDKLEFEASGMARTMKPDLPPGELMTDAFFGDVIIYPGDFETQIPLVRATPEPGEIELTAVYQGCAKDLICYPPVTKKFNIPLNRVIATAFADESGTTPLVDTSWSESTDFAIWWLIATAFGTGLLLTFTPCVLPLIPILSSIVVGSGEASKGGRGGTLSIVYVLGTAVAYAGVGAVAGATGDQLQASFQNPWAIGAMSVVFAIMALSMFGLYEIRMPAAFETHIQKSSTRLGGGTISAVFVLGILSALVVSACVSPLLISVLGIAIAKADPVLGATMMTAMAFGMGAVLIAIGFGIGVALPKSGPWMDRIKQGFGVILLGVAVYVLGAIPEVPVLLLWAALFVVTGVYLGAAESLPVNANGWRFFWKGIGMVLLVWGVLALIGGVVGNRDIMRPLPQIAGINLQSETAVETGNSILYYESTATVAAHSLHQARQPMRVS